MGNKSPLIPSANLFKNTTDLKLPFLPKFGHLHCLFIGKSEHPQALGCLAHCLKHIYLPQIGLDRASSDRICNLQVSRTRPNFRPLWLKLPATSCGGRPSGFTKDAAQTIPRVSLRFDWPEKLPVGFAFAKLSKIALWPPKFGLSHFGPFH